MTSDPLRSPVVVDGRVNDEKLRELLRSGTEYDELDFKRVVDLQVERDTVKLVKHVGAMRVRGGYIVIGVDDHGRVTGDMDDVDMSPFDPASLASKLERYARPLQLHSAVHEIDGHTVVVICVMPSPSGCTFFIADGTYTNEDGEVKTVFAAGDVFWRTNTRSVSARNAEGIEEIGNQRLAREKRAWLEEQQEIRQRERAELTRSGDARERANSALGTVNADLPSADLNQAALELLRAEDSIGIQHLINDFVARARALVEADDLDLGLADLLDKLTCLAATFLAYGQPHAFERVIRVLSQVYSMPLGDRDADGYGLSTRLDPTAPAPHVWLAVIRRVFGLGALAVRLEQWEAVRMLTLVKPDRLSDYDRNWLRHALTMVARAGHFNREDGRVELSLLSLAAEDVARLDCLRLDSPAEDSLLTSLAQFDVLSNVAAIGDAGNAEHGAVFYPNFARFRQTRIHRVVERLLTDQVMREAIFPDRSESDLAVTLASIGDRAQNEGWRYDGFHGWDDTLVGEFIDENLPTD